MRPQPLPRLEPDRVMSGPWRSRRGDRSGQFVTQGPCGEKLVIIASDGLDPRPMLADWEHVSVSTRRRVPNWQEMCFVKALFWGPEECVVQYHPPESSYVNNHPYVLHLWKPVHGNFMMPPSILVGCKDHGVISSPEDAKALQRKVNKQLDDPPV